MWWDPELCPVCRLPSLALIPLFNLQVQHWWCVFLLRASDVLFSSPTIQSTVLPWLGLWLPLYLQLLFPIVHTWGVVTVPPPSDSPVCMLSVSTSMVSTPAVATDTHLSQAPSCRREQCGCLHQGLISSFSNPFALTDLSLGFTPPEPELESLTFCLLFCSLTLGLCQWLSAVVCMSLTTPLCFYPSTFAGPRAWVSVSGSVLSFAWKWWPCGR